MELSMLREATSTPSFRVRMSTGLRGRCLFIICRESIGHTVKALLSNKLSSHETEQ